MAENKTADIQIGVLPWQRLMTKGHVWVARLNAIRWIGPALLVAALASIYYDVKSATTGAAQSVAAAASGDHWLVKALSAGWLTPAAPKAPEPVRINVAAIAAVPAGLNAAELGGRSDIVKFLNDEIASLNATGNLDPQYPTSEIRDLRKPWVTPAGTADAPLVKKSSDGKTIWLASIGSDGATARPVFGAFRKSGGRWSWIDVSILFPDQMTFGRNPLPVNNVANAMARDFPETVLAGGAEK